MLSILVFVALASAMPIATEPNVVPQNTADSSRFLSMRIATAAVDLVQRSVCDSAVDDASASDCPHVNSVLRAALALFFLFAFLVLLHVWQAAQYNTIQPVLGAYVSDDAGDINHKTPCILLDESDSA